MKKTLRILSKFLVPAIIIFFLIKRLIESLDKTKGINIIINIPAISYSLAFLIISFFLLPIAWKFILKKLKEKLDLKKANIIWFKAQISRYIPGIIWPYIGRVFLSKKHGISKTKTVLSMIIENLFLVITCLFWSAIFILPYLKLKALAYFYIASLAIMIICLHPKIIEFIIRFVLEKIKKEKTNLQISYKDTFCLFSMYSLRWIIMGIGFVLLSNSIHSIEISKWPFLIGVFAISWFVGFVVAFAPGGLGFKEGAISVLLNLIMPINMAIAIALIARLWLIIGEVLSLAIVTLWQKWFK